MTGYRDLDHYDAMRDRLAEFETDRERHIYELELRALTQAQVSFPGKTTDQDGELSSSRRPRLSVLGLSQRLSTRTHKGRAA